MGSFSLAYDGVLLFRVCNYGETLSVGYVVTGDFSHGYGCDGEFSLLAIRTSFSAVSTSLSGLLVRTSLSRLCYVERLVKVTRVSHEVYFSLGYGGPPQRNPHEPT